MAEKYNTFFRPIDDGASIRVRFFDSEYSGDSIALDTVSLRLKIDGIQNYYDNNVLFSSVTWEVLAESRHQFFEIFDGKKDQYTLQIEATDFPDTFNWNGFVSTKEHSEVIKEDKYVVRIVAYDGITYLQDLAFIKTPPFNTVSHEIMPYRAKMNDYISYCLSRVGWTFDGIAGSSNPDIYVYTMTEQNMLEFLEAAARYKGAVFVPQSGNVLKEINLLEINFLTENDNPFDWISLGAKTTATDAISDVIGQIDFTDINLAYPSNIVENMFLPLDPPVSGPVSESYNYYISQGFTDLFELTTTNDFLGFPGDYSQGFTFGFYEGDSGDFAQRVKTGLAVQKITEVSDDGQSIGVKLLSNIPANAMSGASGTSDSTGVWMSASFNSFTYAESLEFTQATIEVEVNGVRFEGTGGAGALVATTFPKVAILLVQSGVTYAWVDTAGSSAWEVISASPANWMYKNSELVLTPFKDIEVSGALSVPINTQLFGLGFTLGSEAVLRVYVHDGASISAGFDIVDTMSIRSIRATLRQQVEENTKFVLQTNDAPPFLVNQQYQWAAFGDPFTNASTTRTSAASDSNYEDMKKALRRVSLAHSKAALLVDAELRITNLMPNFTKDTIIEFENDRVRALRLWGDSTYDFRTKILKARLIENLNVPTIPT